jgi:hypothetical protein
MRVRILFSLVAGIVMVASARAGAGMLADDSKLDQKALAVLKQASEFFKNPKSFHVDMTVASSTSNASKKAVIQSEGCCDLQQPNHFAIRMRRTNEDGGVCVVCDGKNVFTSATKMKQFTKSPAPADLSRMGATMMVLDPRNTGILFPNVLAEDPYEQLMSGVNSCAYAGREKVGDVPAHCLKFAQDAQNWEIWIAAEGKPLVLKMHSKVTTGDGGSLDIAETYSNWKFDETPAGGSTFSFSPPKDAKKVQNLDANMEKK